jgi:hypothetical protein
MEGHDASAVFRPAAVEFARHYGLANSRGVMEPELIDNHKKHEDRRVDFYAAMRTKQNLNVVAYFGHGLEYGLVTPRIFKYDDGGAGRFVAEVKGRILPGSKLLLYACTAGVRGGWANLVSDMLGSSVTVYGHDRAGHATTNPYVTRYPCGGAGSEYLIPGTTHHPMWKNWVCKLKCQKHGTPLWLEYPYMSREQILAECAKYDWKSIRAHDEHCPYHHHNINCEKGRKHPELFPGQVAAQHHAAPRHAGRPSIPGLR